MPGMPVRTRLVVALRLETAATVDPYLAYLRARAANLVAIRWTAIERVAQALIERRVLSGDEVADLIRPSLQRPVGDTDDR